jgi:radical SAM superfamily enzyme YgiQ (UPF0313 family)
MVRRTLLLVSPPVLHGQRWWKDQFGNKPHLSSLTGYVRDIADTRILELDLEAGADLAPLLANLDDALTDDVGLLGISCWTSLQYLGTLAVSERVRHLAPHVPIVVGGHHATGLPSDFDHRICDWVVTGDGEDVLRRLCATWPARPKKMTVLAGGIFDQSNPDHIDWRSYGHAGVKDRAVWVGTSRGCAFRCRFCVEPERGAAYSRYSVEAQLDILERLVSTHEPEVIAFSDPLFGANRRWLEAFLDRLEARSLPVLYWAETRIDLMSAELLERFHRCRFMLDFGLDSGSETMVRLMEKAANPTRYLHVAHENLARANAIGLNHGVYVIFNFPGETPDTVQETMAFLEGVGANGGPMSGSVSCGTFFILPGTHAYLRMAENRQRYGTIIRNPSWWRQAGDHYDLATDVLPSSAWVGREHELRDFVDWNGTLNAQWCSRQSIQTQEFRRDFYAGRRGLRSGEASAVGNFSPPNAA